MGSGDIVIDYTNLSNKPTIPTVPTNVSAFNNDAGYLTSHQDLTSIISRIEALEAATTAKKSRFFSHHEVDIPSPRTVLILLLIDLIVTAFLILSLPELPRIYIDLVAESLAIIVSFIAIVNEIRK